MSDGKQPTQASGGDGRKGAPDGVGETTPSGRTGGSESSGGAYPNPYDQKDKGDRDDYGGTLGHGGQSDQGYFGPGQIDGEKADKDKPGTVGQGG